MVNSTRIAKRSDTKSTEKIFIAFGDLEAMTRTPLSSTVGRESRLQEAKEKVSSGEIVTSGRGPVWIPGIIKEGGAVKVSHLWKLRPMRTSC